MPRQEVYHSSTLGRIPLSFTGRRLMQNLREEFQRLLSIAIEKARNGQVGVSREWDRVSEARGRIAEYMSRLEARQGGWDKTAQMCGFEDTTQALNYLLTKQQKSELQRSGEPHSYWTRSRNEYVVGLIIEADRTIRTKRVEREPGSFITTEVQLGGSVQIAAYSMDEALDMALKQAHDHGFTELTKKDFDVRLVSVPEA